MTSVTNENLAELFYAKLKTSANPGVVLAQFYGALLDKSVGRQEIIKMNMLVKLFGRNNTFFSIIDSSRADIGDEFPFGLLYKICKNRLEAAIQSDSSLSSFDSLDKKIAKAVEEIAKVKAVDGKRLEKLLSQLDEGVSDD